MEYEQFFQTQDGCDCSNYIKGMLIALATVALLTNCILTCKTNQKLNKVENENQTLKSIISKSIDKTFVRLVKNGSYDEDDDE